MEHEKEQELARQRLLTASTNLNKQREEGERDKVAIARAKRESSIRMNKGMLEEEERDIKQRREDKFLRDNFPEAINEDDECSSEDGRKTRHKKSKHRPISQNNENDNKEKQVNTEPGEEEDEDSSLETDEAMDEEGIQEQLKNFAQTATVGHSFLKHTPRKRRKQDRIVKVTFGEDNSPKQISWGSGTRHMDFDDILYIAWGHWTPLFQTKKNQLNPKLCFSIVSTSETIDLEGQSKDVVELWVKGLRKLIGQSDEEAVKLCKQALDNADVEEESHPKKEKEKEKEKTNSREHKKRARHLMLLQQDLFLMTTTTVFQQLEKEGYKIDNSVKEHFDPKLMYQDALKEDVPWRDWHKWVGEKVMAFLVASPRSEGQPLIENKRPIDQMTMPPMDHMPVSSTSVPNYPMPTYYPVPNYPPNFNPNQSVPIQSANFQSFPPPPMYPTSHVGQPQSSTTDLAATQSQNSQTSSNVDDPNAQCTLM